MNNNITSQPKNEIDWVEQILYLYRYRFQIFVIFITFTVFGWFVSQQSPTKYSSKIQLEINSVVAPDQLSALMYRFQESFFSEKLFAQWKMVNQSSLLEFQFIAPYFSNKTSIRRKGASDLQFKFSGPKGRSFHLTIKTTSNQFIDDSFSYTAFVQNTVKQEYIQKKLAEGALIDKLIEEHPEFEAYLIEKVLKLTEIEALKNSEHIVKVYPPMVLEQNNLKKSIKITCFFSFLGLFLGIFSILFKLAIETFIAKSSSED